MVEIIRSRISSHHNYRINGILTPGFMAGDPGKGGFYLLADVLLPGETTARISGRFFDEKGQLMAELFLSRASYNPGGCLYRSEQGGFLLAGPDGETMLRVLTKRFANGYLTTLEGRIYDEGGEVRMENREGMVRLLGSPVLTLSEPWKGI
jgi:hypothetical protein